MANTLTLQSIDKDGVVRLASEGDITSAQVRAGERNPFESLLGVTWFSNRVLLDFSQTGYIDSAAIGWLISSSKDFKKGGGLLALHSVGARVRQLLDMLRVGKIVPMLPDEAAARQFVTATATSGSGQ